MAKNVVYKPVSADIPATNSPSVSPIPQSTNTFVLSCSNPGLVSATNSIILTRAIVLTGIYASNLALLTPGGANSTYDVSINKIRIMYDVVYSSTAENKNSSAYLAIPNWVLPAGSLLQIDESGSIGLNTSFVSIIGYYI
jgi:hypothetical protein